MGFSVHLRLDKGRLAHETQGDALLQIAGQQGIGNRLHDAAEIAGDVVVAIHDIDRAAGQLLDEAQIGRERIVADGEARIVQPLVMRGCNPFGQVLGDSVRVVLHGLAVMGDGLLAQAAVIEQANDDGKENQQADEQLNQAPGDAVPAPEAPAHGSFLSNL